MLVYQRVEGSYRFSAQHDSKRFSHSIKIGFLPLLRKHHLNWVGLQIQVFTLWKSKTGSESPLKLWFWREIHQSKCRIFHSIENTHSDGPRGFDPSPHSPFQVVRKIPSCYPIHAVLKYSNAIIWYSPEIFRLNHNMISRSCFYPLVLGLLLQKKYAGFKIDISWIKLLFRLVLGLLDICLQKEYVAFCEHLGATTVSPGGLLFAWPGSWKNEETWEMISNPDSSDTQGWSKGP